MFFVNFDQCLPYFLQSDDGLRFVEDHRLTTPAVVQSHCASVCLCLCLSVAICPHYCMDLDVTWGNGRGCPLVVHYWADLQSVALLWQHNANPSYKLASIPRYDDIVQTFGGVWHAAGRWLAGDGGVLNITGAAWTAGFQWWRSGDITRTQNVSEYMLVLALCLVHFCWTFCTICLECFDFDTLGMAYSL